MLKRPPKPSPAAEVHRSPQPDGDGGVQNTFDRVAEAALRGGEDARVRSHVTYVLKACGWPMGTKARAECLMADTRTMGFLSDPVNAEFVPEVWTMVPNHVTGDAPMFVAEDCDGLTARWLGMCLAAGIPAKVVGYWFEGDRREQHVAGSIWDDIGQEWLDGEPSDKNLPLGSRLPAARRQERELPSMTITCDDEFCPTKTPPIAQGVESFIRVGALPDGAGTSPDPNAATPDVPAEALASLGMDMSDLADSIETHWSVLKLLYDAGRARFAAYGITRASDLEPLGWSPEQQQMAIDLGVMSSIAASALRQAASGDRGIWPVVLANGEHTFAIEKLPLDKVAIDVDSSGSPELVDATGALTHASVPDNSVGNPAVIAAATAVMVASVGYLIVRGLETLTQAWISATETFLEDKVSECQSASPPCSQEELDRRLAELHKYRVDKTDAETRLAQAKANEPGALDKAMATFNKVVYVLGGVAAIYGGIKVLQAITTSKKQRAS